MANTSGMIVCKTPFCERKDRKTQWFHFDNVLNKLSSFELAENEAENWGKTVYFPCLPVKARRLTHERQEYSSECLPQ